MPTDGLKTSNPGMVEAATILRPVNEELRKRLFVARLTWLFAWGTKGGLAVVDQASFAGAQFAVNILLARWVGPAEYGAFAVAYSVFLLVAAVHSALLIEPMMVFGSGRYLKNKRSYLGILLHGHWLLTAPAGGALLGTGWLIARMESRSLGYALCALGIALPFILLAWLTRRAFYIELQPGHAAAGGALFFGSVVLFVCGLHAVGALTPASAILAMGAAATLAAGLHLMWLRPEWSQEGEGLTTKQVASAHWGYGRWVLAAAFPSWALLNVYYVVLPMWFGLKSAGALKALMNLAMPATHAIIAFGVLMIPLLVRHRDAGGIQLMQRTVWRITGTFTTGAAVYLLLLWFFRIPIMHLLYGGKYLDYSGLPVLLVGLVPLVTACSVACAGALRALECPDRIFWADVVASIFVLTIGLGLVATCGVLGAVAGYLIGYAAFPVALWFFYGRLRQQLRNRRILGLAKL